MILWVLSCQTVVHPPLTWADRQCEYHPPNSDGQSDFQRGLLTADNIELNVVLKGPSDGDCLPAIVVMPPGLQSGAKDSETEWSNRLVDWGFWVIHWDPRGRGLSTGQEVANGREGAADAAALLRWVSTLPNIDAHRISILSRSFGGALAAGALAQHADLKPNLWIDYEAPGWLNADIQYVEGRSRDTLEAMAVDEQWWHDRSPAYWAPNIAVPYQRLQGLPDHAQGPRYAHAQAILDRLSSSETWINDHLWTGDELAEANLILGGVEPDNSDFIALIEGTLRQFE